MPFGCPVEPEVYRMNSGSSASIISAGHSDEASSNKGCNQVSRPSFIEILLSIRLTTNTCSTPEQDSNASSTIPFKSMVLLPLNEPSAVMTILQSESLILVDRAVEEKPANTTECMAPILAQAKIAMLNSGIIGT